MLRKSILIAILILFGSQFVSAHDAWLEPEAGGLVLFYGHGPKHDPYDPAKVKDVKAVDCKGKSLPIEIEKKSDSVSLKLKNKPAVVTLLFDGGYGCKTTDGWKKMTKRQAQGKYKILYSYKSQKFTKALLMPCKTHLQPKGLTFEIVPEKDPFSVKTGELLPVKVLLDGKPLEGALFKIADVKNPDKKTEIKTSEEGKASIAIQKSGFQLIVAKLKRPLKGDPDADTLSLSTSLTFGIK